MNVSRLGALCLGSVWLVACATAQDSNLPGGSGGGAGGSISGGTPGASGSKSAFGGGTGVPTSGGSSALAGAGGSVGGTSSAAFGGGVTSAGTGGAAIGGAGGASGGSSGSAGAGGSAPVFETGVCAENPTMSLSYKTTSVNSQISGVYQFINTSDTPIPVAQLKIRYFFSSEKVGGWTPTIYDTRLSGGTGGDRDLKTGAALTVVTLPSALEGADTYAELTYTGAATLEKTATGNAQWGMQPVSNNPPDQNQTNDYSYNAADTVLTVWDHVVIYQGDTLVWGCVPKALGAGGGGAGGGAGTGGSSGAAGTGGAAGLGGVGGTSSGTGGTSSGAGGAGGSSSGAGGASSGGAGGTTSGGAGAGGSSSGAGGASGSSAAGSAGSP